MTSEMYLVAVKRWKIIAKRITSARRSRKSIGAAFSGSDKLDFPHLDLTEKTNTLPTTDSRTGSSTARVKHFSQFTRVWQRLRRSAILYGLFATIIRVGANILLLPLILKRFSPAELALWWVFVAL